MRRAWLVGLFAALFAGCLVAPGRRGGLVLVPALPPIVVLESEPYYRYGGFYYFYQGDRWSYSRSRSGPWEPLPRDRYPREVRVKGQGHDRGRDDERGRGEKRGHDEKD